MSDFTVVEGDVTLVRHSDGAEVGTASVPIRTDPTGTTTQPVSITDGVSTLPLIMDGTTSLPVKDDETRLLLTHMLRELRAIRLMLGHATELQDDEESDL